MRFSISPGKRLRYFRLLRGMTQRSLGIEAGLSPENADVRIAQYESGARIPKEKTLTALAEALSVSPAALAIPQLEDDAAFMHLLFALEDLYGITLMPVHMPSGSLEKALSEWQRLSKKRENDEITAEEYDRWRFLFSGYANPHRSLQE